jgi:beta-glucosidase
LEEEYYREGIYVGYRYFDTFKVEPKYPFGYGLSYTEFTIESAVHLDKTEAVVEVRVTNSGEIYSGKEVVQVYVSCPDGKLKKEYQKLAAFAKTKVLAPGESEVLCIKFNMKDVASYLAEEGAMVLEPGDYAIRVGNSSRNTKVAAYVRTSEEIIVSKHVNICKNRVVMEELQPENEKWNQIMNAPVLELAPEEFECEIYEYKTPEVYRSPELDAVLNVLSTKEMISLLVGAGALSNGKYFCAPGSAGTTTGKLVEKGVPDVSLADGPAGLRLQRRAVVLRNGKLKPVDPFISTMKYMPGILKKKLLGDPDKHPVVYQFTTSFPVGLALAQTWNMEVLEKVGQAVGEEMKAYGVTYWLAPALNIHRNPLCGRNFEYYSEDPYLAGKATAAITKGVQKSRGCYVTIKHFCCNNQEDNRMHTNANVSERALREIYLRGFEIAVKESRPGSVMTSYNKVNGVYANNSYDLLTKVLRNEWGFDGLVMTDWFATGKKEGNHALAIATGNDLIMPGGEAAEKEIYKALKAGLISEEDIRRCAANILRGIMSSRIYQAYKKSSYCKSDK